MASGDRSYVVLAVHLLQKHGLEVHLAHPLGLNGATAGAEATSPTPLQNPVAQPGAHNAPGTPAPGYQITSEQGRE